jgi:membrane glycosyltransferase
MLVRRHDRRGMGGAFRGLVSVLIEIVVSALIAPVMMLMQSRSVMEILLGRDAGWSAQRRDDGNFARGEFARAYAFPTMLGALLGASAYAVSAPLLFWMSPVVAGLLLAIPMAAFTARSAVGRALRGAGLLLTPEERSPPAILERANALAAAGRPAGTSHPLVRLAEDRALRAAHESMLEDVPRRRKGEVDVHLAVAMMRIADADSRADAIAALAAREAFSVMTSREALRKLIEKAA